jgi:predicted DCC family thiol-disulfide oxidoreductase YuxK
MRLPNTAHTSQPWRIHELTPDFRLEDVWELPTVGGLDDFRRLVQLIAAGDPSHGPSRVARTLWAIRWKLGGLLGWDDPDEGLTSRVPTLRDRLPADLRDGPSGPEFKTLPFRPLYLIDDEFAAEIANRTMHGVMHIGLVPAETGGYRVQEAVLVKPNGFFGIVYMAAIRPFRRLIVYPASERAIERRWRDSDLRRDAGGLPGERRWAVLYDADCGFCIWLLSALLRWDRRARLRPIALQRREAEDLLRTLTRAERMASWHLISPSGARQSGGAALPPLLRVLRGGWLPAAAFACFPALTERGYRWVADNRSRLSSWVPSSAMERARQRVRRREQGSPR